MKKKTIQQILSITLILLLLFTTTTTAFTLTPTLEPEHTTPIFKKNTDTTEPFPPQQHTKNTPQQLTQQQIWNKTYGGAQNDKAYQFEIASDSTIIIVGETESYGSGYKDIFLLKIDEHGKELWNISYGGLSNDIGYNVQETNDCGYIITGQTRSTNPNKSAIILLKTNKDGEHQWNKTYYLSQENVGKSVIQTQDGGYLIAGYHGHIKDGFIYTQPFLLKTDQNGTHLWNQSYAQNEGLFQYANTVIEVDDGYIVTGSYDRNENGYTQTILLKTDKQGNRIWRKFRYGGDQGYGLSQDNDAGYVIIGTQKDGYNIDNIHIIKTNSTGEKLWDQTFDNRNRLPDQAYTAIPTPDKGYLIAGYTTSFYDEDRTDKDIWILKLNQTGDHQWDTKIGYKDTDEISYDIQHTANNELLILASRQTKQNTSDIWLIKTTDKEIQQRQTSNRAATPLSKQKIQRITQDHTPHNPLHTATKQIQNNSHQTYTPIDNPSFRSEKITQFNQTDFFLPNNSYKSNELIIKFKQPQNTDTLDAFVSTKLIQPNSIKNIIPLQNNKQSSSLLQNTVKITYSKETNIQDIKQQYNRNPHIEYVQENYIMGACIVPNDPFFYSAASWKDILDHTNFLDQYHLHTMDAPGAWQQTTGSEDIVVAVLDSGIDYTLPDLRENMWINKDEIPDNNIDDDQDGFIDNLYGADFINNDGDPIDDHYHGTFCAGIIGATGNNNLGLTGVSWKVQLMALKGLSKTGSGPSDVLAQAIIWAADNGADVISNSWSFGGMLPTNPLVEDAIRYAHEKGVIVIFAAGNALGDGRNIKWLSPQNMPETITVSATNAPPYTEKKYGYSNWGKLVDVAAPGVSIMSLLPSSYQHPYALQDRYIRLSGTSAACPQVAGIIALLLAKDNTLTFDMIRTMLKGSVEQIDKKYSYPIGSGRINASKALQRTPSIALLENPPQYADIKGVFTIQGSAWSTTFQYYQLSYVQQGTNIWTIITNSTTPLISGTLATLDTCSLADDAYVIKLDVICTDHCYNDTLEIVVNNRKNDLIVDDDGGPDVNFTTIEEAVAHAGDNDRILIHEGEYDISGPPIWDWVNIDKSISLIALGDTENTIIDCWAGFFFYNASNITIKGCTFQSTVSLWLYESDTIHIEKNIFKGSYGVYASQSQHITITDNDFQAFYSIVLKESNRNTIEKNTFDTLTQAIALTHATNNTINDNTIQNCYWAIGGSNSRNNHVSNLTIHGAIIAGIELHNSPNNTFKHITMNSGGFILRGTQKEAFQQTIDTSNTLYEKPIYYYKNQNNIIVPSDAAQIILCNVTHGHIADTTLQDIDYPLLITYSTNITIENTTIIGNTYTTGIFIETSHQCSITNTTLSECAIGLYQNATASLHFTNNTILNSYDGVSIINSENAYLAENTIEQIYNQALSILQSTIHIQNNTITENEVGIALFISPYCQIEKNTIHSTNKAILLQNSPSTTISNNKLTTASILISSEDITKIENYYQNIDNTNTINDKPIYYFINQTNIQIPQDTGLALLINCKNTDITNLDLATGTMALELFFCESIKISQNTLSDILLISSTELTIEENTFSSCKYHGILMQHCTNTLLQQNTFVGTTSLPENIFQAIGLYHSSNNTIKNNHIHNNTGFIASYFSVPFYGISIEDYSTHNTIAKNLIEYNNGTYGILLNNYATHNTISNNIVKDNGAPYSWGLVNIYDSNENTFLNNTILRQAAGAGFIINQCKHLLIKNNTFIDDRMGIHIYNSYTNIILHNIFENYINAVDYNPDPLNRRHGINFYDNGYSQGGNYWSDYYGEDHYKGPKQNITGSDGIGDIPYEFKNGATFQYNYDYYPLIGDFAYPDLSCAGHLTWTRVKPGDTVTGSFTIENSGDPKSKLDWFILGIPIWGEWEITPKEGWGLTPEQGPITIQVTVIAPDDGKTEFTGEIVIYNRNRYEDHCIIPVSLTTPTNHQNTPLFPESVIHHTINFLFAREN